MTESMIEKIKNRLSAAILQKDDQKKNILKVLLAEIQRLHEVPNDDKVYSIIRKMIEGNMEMLKYKADNVLLFENVILEELLPSMMSEQEIKDVLVSLNLQGEGNAGKAIGAAMKALKGSPKPYDNKIVINVVNQILKGE